MIKRLDHLPTLIKVVCSLFRPNVSGNVLENTNTGSIKCTIVVIP